VVGLLPFGELGRSNCRRSLLSGPGRLVGLARVFRIQPPNALFYENLPAEARRLSSIRGCCAITVVRSQPRVAASVSYAMLRSAAIRAKMLRCTSVKGAFVGAFRAGSSPTSGCKGACVPIID